jgi:hypothetical protein
MAKLSQSNINAIIEVSRKLRIANPQWLSDLINFETAGTYDPKIKNFAGSSAKGLIQFMDSTAKDLGFSSSQQLVNQYPDFNSQLKGPVYDYLKRYSPYNREFELYMAVFFPAAMRYNADTSFSQIFQKVYGNNWQTRYKSFERYNPGIKTPQDYVDKVKKKPGIRILVFSLGSALIAGGLLWFYLKNK